MDEIVYKGRRYTRNGAKWTDDDHAVVNEPLQRELNLAFHQNVDFTGYNLEMLVAEGDKCKSSFTYDRAILFYEKAVELADEDTLQYILPRISSCYRREKQPRKAIELFSYAKAKYGEEFLTSALLTSVAAAYCDLMEYENALRCCRWAYKNCGGGYDESLAKVFARIKKESGLE